MDAVGLLSDITAALDWIDKLDGLVFAIRHRGAHVFAVKFRAGWAGSEVEAELKRLHIPIGGRMVTRKHIFFLVASGQDEWAEYVMLRAGIPLTGKPVNPDNYKWTAEYRGRVPSWAERKVTDNKRGRSTWQRIKRELW